MPVPFTVVSTTPFSYTSKSRSGLSKSDKKMQLVTLKRIQRANKIFHEFAISMEIDEKEPEIMRGVEVEPEPMKIDEEEMEWEFEDAMDVSP